MYHDLSRSKEVKFWSKPSNQGQIGQISRNKPNIHMFQLQILSRIQNQDSLRSTQVLKRSKLGQSRQIRQISRNVPNIHMVRLRFVSRIQIQNSLRSNQVIKRSNLGQSWVIAVKLGSNRADKTKCTQYTYGSTPNFVPNTNSKFFEVESGHQEVKLG